MSETSIQINEVDENESSLEGLWETLETNENRMMPFIEETIERWNNRTQIMKNIN